MLRLATLVLSTSCALANLAGTPYLMDQMSEATTRKFAFKNDGTHNCEPGYTGSDCSLRTCPYSLAFITAKESEHTYTPSSTQESVAVSFTDSSHLVTATDGTFTNMHAYKECGGRGVCDRSTGKCKCFPSFTGRGCRRTTCPNDCSGHGICQDDYHSVYGRSGVNQVKKQGEDTQARFWAVKKFRSCKCDRGFHGFDCSLRTCPYGDDPETECSDQQSTDRQTISCSGKAANTDAWFSLRFKDHLGGAYRTRPIFVKKAGTQIANADSIQNALEALPNFAIPSVEVDMVTQAADLSKFTFTVDFTDGATTNQQALLSVDTKTSCADSSQPKFVFDDNLACNVTRVAHTGTLKEAHQCGGRGLCDTSTGICNCFKGYYGDSCSQITTYV